MYFRRDQVVELLRKGADLTLAEVLEAMQVPYGLLEIDSLGTEDWFVVGHRLCHGSADVAAGGAGTRSQGGLANVSPAPDQLGLVILEQVILQSEGVFAYQGRQDATITGGGGVGFVRDTRWGSGVARSVHGFLGQQNTLPVTGTFLGQVARMLGTTSLVIPWPMVISPGHNIAFDAGADQQVAHAFFFWRELDLRAR